MNRLLLGNLIVGMSALVIVLFLNIADVEPQKSEPINLQGEYLAIVSDGDFFASTYVDSQLTPLDPRYRDTLTIVPLPLGSETVSLEVSNSVNAPPEVLVLSPDGKTAFVIEYLGQRNDDTRTREDIRPGRWLTMVNLSNPSQPQISDRLKLAQFPEAVDLDPNGKWLAITTDSGEAEVLQLVPVYESSLGNPVSITLENLGIPNAEGDLNASYVEWHPNGRYLALNLYRQNRIVFFEFTEDKTTREVSLKPWGEPVNVDADPYSGCFTPDGKYYLTANWKRNFNADSLEGRLPTESSTISVIRLGDNSHRVITTVKSDRSSEGIAVSPDGKLVATANMRDTALPQDSSRFTRHASVSLFSFDASTGQLTKVGDFLFEGVLPEGISFDATGEHLIVATFEYLDSDRGGLEVWRVKRELNLDLQYAGRIDVPHGSHQVIVASR